METKIALIYDLGLKAPAKIERLRQYIGKASFSSGVDRFASMECLEEISAEGKAIEEARQVEHDALRGLFGLVQLVLGRNDLTEDLRDALCTNHRVLEAQRILGTCVVTGEPLTGMRSYATEEENDQRI